MRKLALILLLALPAVAQVRYPQASPHAVLTQSVGTTEVTRLGMGEREMEEIADLAADVLVRGRDAAEVRRRVVDLRSGFQKLRYCFD